MVLVDGNFNVISKEYDKIICNAGIDITSGLTSLD